MGYKTDKRCDSDGSAPTCINTIFGNATYLAMIQKSCGHGARWARRTRRVAKFGESAFQAPEPQSTVEMVPWCGSVSFYRSRNRFTDELRKRPAIAGALPCMPQTSCALSPHNQAFGMSFGDGAPAGKPGNSQGNYIMVLLQEKEGLTTLCGLIR